MFMTSQLPQFFKDHVFSPLFSIIFLLKPPHRFCQDSLMNTKIKNGISLKYQSFVTVNLMDLLCP